MEELREVLISAAVLIVPVLAAIAVRYLQVYLNLLGEKVKDEIGQGRYDMLLSFVEIVIRAAEQAIGLEGDEEKKQYAFDQLRGLADSMGLEISDDQLNALIEGVYNAIKGELKGTVSAGG